jgi:hypothetical protein
MVGWPAKLEIGRNRSAGKPAIWKTELPEVIFTGPYR